MSLSPTGKVANPADSDWAPGSEVVSSSRPKSLIGNSGWSLLSWAWLTGVTFFLTPFLIARLGTGHYGLYVLIMSISGLMGLADMGLAEATLRYVAYYYGRQDMAGINRAVGATLSVYLVTGCLAWAILFVGAPWIAGLLALPVQDLDLATSLLRLMAINYGFVMATGAYGTIPRALQRYDIDSRLIVGQSVLQVAGTVAILLAGLAVRELIAWSVVTAIMRQMANMIVARQLIPNLRLLPSPSRAGLREVFGYGVFSSLTQIVGTVASQADRLLLGALVSASSVAYLNVPKSLVQRGGLITPTAGDVLFPRFSATQELAEQRRLFLNTTWGMLCITILIFVPVTVLVPDFLRLWIGPEFARESAWIGQILAFGAIARGAFVPSQKLFQGAGKPQYVTAWYVTSSVILVGMNLLLISKLGLKGAGYASLIELAVPFSALLLAWKRVLRSESYRALARAVLLPYLVALCCLVLGWWARSMFPYLGWIGLLAFAISHAGVVAMALIGADRLGGGPDRHSAAFLRPLSRLLQVSTRRHRPRTLKPSR
jgi:O-antigen/teichoic acid export membrane protein